MDDIRTELIVSLCTQAGMIMEDASLLAVTMPAQASAGIGEALTRLQADVSAMTSLIAAAQTLYGRA